MLRRHSTHTLDHESGVDHEPGVDPVVHPGEDSWEENRREVARSRVGSDSSVTDPFAGDPLATDPLDRDAAIEREPVSRPLPPPAAPAVVPVLPGEDRSAYATTVSQQRFSVASLLGAAAGVGLLVVGIVALLRGGLGGPIDEPIVQVLGFGHTPLLGLIDIAMGVLLLAAAAASSRGALTFLGLMAVVAGAVAVAEPGELADRLAVERAFGWIWLIGGVLIALAAWLLPVYERETRRVHRTERAV